jgi:hypothetical protein
MDDPLEGYRPLTLRLDENNGAVFAAVRDAVTIKLENGPTMQGLVWRFHSRLDSEAVMIMHGHCLDMPPAFHASLQATAALLKQSHARGMKYEGEETMRLNPRAILQHWARIYSVEVDSVANFYPQARMWLSHKNLQHPATLDALVNNIAASQKRRLI